MRELEQEGVPGKKTLRDFYDEKQKPWEEVAIVSFLRED